MKKKTGEKKNAVETNLTILFDCFRIANCSIDIRSFHFRVLIIIKYTLLWSIIFGRQSLF